MNKNNTSQICLKQFSEEQNSILDALYACGIPYMRIKDYVNTASTCSQWRDTLISNHYHSILRDIHLTSTPLFQRFVSKAKEIDRTDTPKSYRRVVPVIDIAGGLWAVAGAAGGQPDLIYETMPQSQKEYEIQALESARAHNDSDQNHKASLQNMSDEDRNDLLDVVNEINIARLTKPEEIIGKPIWSLLESHFDAIKHNSKFESVLLRKNIFDFEKKPDTGLHSYLILLLMFLLICYSYWQVTSQIKHG